MKWTNGKALIATGSPYDPVDMPGSSEKYEVAECNNALVYPGLGMGAIVSKADRVTDKMIVAACKALGDMSPARKDPKKPLLPDFEGDHGRLLYKRWPRIPFSAHSSHMFLSCFL